MAQVLTNPYIGTICGKVGGTIFQRGQGSTTQRVPRWSVSVPNAEALRRMAALAELNRIWAYRLTNAQRLSWGVYANTHPVPSPCTGIRYLTPHNWFVKLNMPRYLAGQPIHLFAP